MGIPTLEQTISEIENEMQIPSMFLISLLKEDDWSFVIKSHAFLEGLLTHVLVESLQRNEVSGKNLDTSECRSHL